MTNNDHNTRHSFVVLLISHICTKIGDGLLNPKTTLTWLLGALAAPSFMIGLLVPIRESGSMLPQLFLSGLLQRFPRRKWAWLTGAFLQGACVFGMALTALFLDGMAAAWIIIVLLALFSLARSICSITGKDLLGRTIPKRRRGGLTGWQSSASGLVVLGIGLTLGNWSGDRPALSTLATLLFGAAALWFCGGLLVALLREPADTRDNTDIPDVWKRLALLRDDAPFRRFVIARTLMMGSALIAPYYVLLAQRHTEGAISVLGYLIVASGLAQWSSSWLWGRHADRSSRWVMIVASALSAALGFSVLLAEGLDWAILQTVWWHAAVFFVSVIAHSGVRVGRKTYVVDLGGDDKRAHYVAVSNTLMGLFLLVAGALGALFGAWSPLAAVAFFGMASLAGALLGRSLQEVTADR